MQFVISKHYGENSFSKSYKVNVDLIISEILTELLRNLKNIHPPRFGAHSLADGCILPFNLFL
jgi:hypothetical protein